MLHAAPELATLVALFAWAATFWNGPLINDVGWQLWIGRQLNEGARLYVDILELNPPLWFWFGALIQRLAAATGIGGSQLLTLALAFCAAGAVFLCRPLLQYRRERMAAAAAIVLTLFLSSPFALGQREQLTAITILPYLALIAARSEGRRVDAPLAVAVAVALFAASGLALKHYFALVPLALEAWLWWRTKRWRLRPELAALAIAATSYAASIVLLTPAYLTTIVPLLRTAYGDFDQPLAVQMLQPAVPAALLAAIMVLRGAARPAMASVALVAAAAFAGAYFIQAKAFAYHTVPLLSVALLALFAGLSSREGRLPWRDTVLAPLALASAAAIPLTADRPRQDHALASATRYLPPGAGITMISSSGVAAWPLVEERGFHWHSRHMMLWMLAPAWSEQKEGAIRPNLQALANEVRREVATEIGCHRPAMVLIDTRWDQLTPEGSVLRHFQGDPIFREGMRHYERAPDSDYLQVFRRRNPARTSAQMCSTRP